MVSWIFMILMTYLGLVWDTATWVSWPADLGRPLAIPIVICWLIIRQEPSRAIWLSGLVALCADSMSAAGPGPFMLTTVLLAWMAHNTVGSRWLGSPWISALLLALTCLSYALLPTFVVWVNSPTATNLLHKEFWHRAVRDTLTTLAAAGFLKVTVWCFLQIVAGILTDSRDRLANRWSMLSD